MTAPSVIIADYGIGNLLSVARAIEKAGGTPEISRDPEKLAGAERLILPGVGAFGDCMRSFLECGFEEPVRHFAATGRPLLGLCVGMQIFFDRSEEFGEHRGLGLIPYLGPRSLAYLGTEGPMHKEDGDSEPTIADAGDDGCG